MGNVIPFARPGSDRSIKCGPSSSCGVVHVWMNNPCSFEIAHESRSGDSWGWFEQYDNVSDAVAAAFALNARELNSKCEVFIPDDVLALLPGGAA